MFGIRNDIAVIMLDNPPVNSLGHALRGRITQQLGEAQPNPAVHEVVLADSEKTFSAGIDVAGFDTSRQLRVLILHTIPTRIETGNRSVVAVITGVMSGDGLELALAYHGRVVQVSVCVSLPEIALDLIPDSDDTQCLPRLVSIVTVQALMVANQPQTTGQLQGSSLFDAMVNNGVTSTAIHHAVALAARGAPYPWARDKVLESTEVDTAITAQQAKFNARQRL